MPSLVMLQQLLLLTLLLLLCNWIPACAGCPSGCSCKWKDGKEWVECAGRGLKGLPQGAREETQVLDLSGNQLISLAADCFFVLRLVNLQRLYLGRARIRSIAERSFTGLQGLVELELADNELDQVPSESFAAVSNLMRLNLAGNPLGSVRCGAFRHLAQLSLLDLARCRLTLLEPGAFGGLLALEWLRLNDNLLTTAPEGALPTPPPGGLHGLTLHGNPWACDCRLGALRDWLGASQAQAPQEAEPICAEPARLKDKEVRKLKAQDLACSPRVTLQDRIEVLEGDNATLECSVEATPRPKIIWMLNGEQLELVQEESLRHSHSESSYEDKITASLLIWNADQPDEGTYVCQAENAAGTTSGNLTLRVLHRERSTVEPPPESPGAGYAAAIAAGALLGTLLALGCLFLGIFLYARRLRSRSKSSLKQTPPISSLVPPSILKKTDHSADKGQHPPGQRGSYSPSGGIGSADPGSANARAASACLEGAPELGEFGEFAEMAYLQSQQMPQRRFIEPDLINEVPSESAYPGPVYRRPCPPCRQPCLETYSSCLDRDGYPLNFGLPKLAPGLGPGMGASRAAATCETLPRIRQRQQLLLSGSAALPATRYSREAEFLARGAHAYPAQPVLEIGYAAVVSTPFIPSPPAAYRSEPAALSPRSLMQGKLPAEPAGAIGGLGSPGVVAPPPPEPAESLDGLEHPESPDEGYVGDAMDV